VNPAGGLARRAWVVHEIERKFGGVAQFLLDSGNFADNPTPQGMLQTKALLDGMERLGYAAVNVGERDVQRGHAAFLDLVGTRTFPFVSANIVHGDTKAPVFSPSVVVEADAAGDARRMRIGVIGAVRFNPTFRRPGPDGGEMVIVAPREVVAREVEKLRAAKVDLVVLLAALPREDARRLVQDVPGVDFVVGSYGGDYTTTKERQGNTWILYSGNQGKRVGETRVYLRGAAIEQDTKLHMLTSTYPSDESMLEFVNSIPRVAPEPLPTVGRVHRTPAAGGPYLGSQTCEGCHGSEAADWAASAHATALETLEAKGSGADPACVRCHVTGHGRSGGFETRAASPTLGGVGCEACHGPGRAHVERTSAPYGEVSVGACTACHDRTNSPKFDVYSYMARVNHRSTAAK